MPDEKPERATPEMKEVFYTFLRAGYSKLTDGYEESFTNFVDGVMQGNPERISTYRRGAQGIIEAGETVLEELGISSAEYEQKFEMIKHVADRARLG